MLASNETPYPPIPAVVEAVTKALGGLNRYPDPTNAALRRRLVRPLRRARRTGSRSATAPATSCSPPATRCSSRAPSSSTRGRRSASTRTSPPPPAPARSRSRSTTSTATTSRRCAREITVATRLVIVCNPNNPTSTALPLDEIAAFVADVPRHVAVILDEAYVEFNAPPGPRRVGRRCSSSTRTSCCCARSRRSTGCAGCASATRCAARRSFRTAVDQVRQPFFCNAAAQAAALEALNHAGRGRPPRRAQPRRARRARGRAARAGPRARRVAGQLRLVRPRRGPRRGRGRCAGLAERGVLVRAGAPLGPRGRAARHRRHAGRERALPRGAGRAAVAVPAPGRGFGCWAGAPSAARADDGAVLLAYRLRDAERRGAEVVLARAEDGERFETIGRLDKDRFGAESLERPALVRTDAGWRIYVELRDSWEQALVDRRARRSASRPRSPAPTRARSSEATSAPASRTRSCGAPAGGWEAWICCHPLDVPGEEDRMTTAYATSADGLAWDVARHRARAAGRAPGTPAARASPPSCRTVARTTTAAPRRKRTSPSARGLRRVPASAAAGLRGAGRRAPWPATATSTPSRSRRPPPVLRGAAARTAATSCAPSSPAAARSAPSPRRARPRPCAPRARRPFSRL